MNIIVEKFLNFFEKDGIIKILIAFVILALSIILSRAHPHAKIFDITAWIGLGYILLSSALFFGAAIINSIKDFISYIKRKRIK